MQAHEQPLILNRPFHQKLREPFDRQARELTQRHPSMHVAHSNPNHPPDPDARPEFGGCIGSTGADHWHAERCGVLYDDQTGDRRQR
jgi:hypothetical protein